MILANRLLQCRIPAIRLVGTVGAADSVSYPTGTVAGMLAITGFIEVEGGPINISVEPVESTGWTSWGGKSLAATHVRAGSYKILDSTDISAGTFTPQWNGSGTSLRAVAVAVFKFEGTTVAESAPFTDATAPFSVAPTTSGAAAPLIVAARASFDRSGSQTTADLASTQSNFVLQTATDGAAFLELGVKAHPDAAIADSTITCTEIGDGGLNTAYFEIT